MKDMTKTATARTGGRLWFSFLFFGLVGQMAWVVENMYFATLAQDIFANSGRGDLSYIITTLMVILSAVFATVTTVFAGGVCDRTGKRKPFIAYGYILWGFTIMAFAFIPMHAAGSMVVTAATLLIVFDCVMTVAGSFANDAAFNAYVADNTTPANRGHVNGALSVLPVLAVVIIFIGLGGLYSAENENNRLFFFVLGSIPTVAGLVALFVLRDAPGLGKTNGAYLADTFYGFRPSVIKENRMMYVTLSATCLSGIAQQTFFSYLINFVVKTLGYGDGFVIPMAVIIVGAAAVTGICGVLCDKFGRRRFYFPLLICATAGILAMYLLQFLSGGGRGVVVYLGGIAMMGGILALGGALSSAFQDYIPKGYEGRFQGVRMCFTVLIPMIVGPLISLAIGMDAMGMNGADFVPPYSMFLAAACVAVLTALPLFFVYKDSKR